MSAINDKRRRAGRRALDRDPQLGYVARRHSARMARNGSIWHDRRIGRKVTRWYRLGQNTGRGKGCHSVMRAFMRSSGHRANILGPWNYVGAGVVDRGRYKYVQIIFEDRRNPGNIWGYPSR